MQQRGTDAAIKSDDREITADAEIQLGRDAADDDGDWNTASVKSSVTFPVGVTTLPIGPLGRVSVFNGLIDGLNSHTKYPKQAWELERWLGSARRGRRPSWAQATTSGQASAASTRSS